MFREFFLFELHYRKKRSATYIYFGIIFLVCFLTAASPTRPSTGATLANAPYHIAQLLALMSLAFTMITSAIMGVSIIRDFEHNTEAMVFTTQLKKGDYLMGRFAGSFVILIFIHCAGWLGLMAGFSLGKFLPWEIAWMDDGILPFNSWHYLQPFFTIILTNLFSTGALYFMSGALGRNSMTIHTQGIILLVLYQIGFTLIGNIDTKPWAALFDPFGIHTIQHVARYWTPAERNSMVIPMEGVMLYNRLGWMGIGIVCLIITQFGFSFNKVRNSFMGPKRIKNEEILVKPKLVKIPIAQKAEGFSIQLQQLLNSAFLYVRMVRKEVPFLAMIVTGLLLIFFNALKMTDIYGSSSYPTAFSVLRVLGSFNLIFIVISIFYSGELVWKERNAGFAPIADALPIPSFTGLIAKCLALIIIYIVLLFGLLIIAFLIQAAYGYFKFDLQVYAGTLFSNIFIGVVLYTLFSFFIQVLVNNKFLGFALCIGLFLVNGLFNRMGIEHDLWQFASGTLGTFSDMNHYGHFIYPFAWFKAYWLGFCMMLLSITVIFSVRGSDTIMRLRWKAGKLRITRPLIILGLASISIFLLSGSYIYYNTAVLNEFETTSVIEERRARYEKMFRQYRFHPQPKIVETNIRMGIYPYRREFDAEGFYFLKNKNDQPVEQIHVQHNTDLHLQISKVTFNRPVTMLEEHAEFRYAIYKLSQPLLPGDSLKMFFKLRFQTIGFEEGRSNTDIVYNGTFLNNLYFPSLGYNDTYELTDYSNRKRQGLEVNDRMLALNDARGQTMNILSDDADHIRFEMVVSTAPDQTAIAPGYLQREWQEGNRKYFHYKMRAPMGNFYSIVSARYKVKRDTWKNVNLEIYHHPDHPFNINRMMEAMKKSLDYYSANFSPFQYQQLRIMEFPRYAESAQSFANTIPFSEGLGFIFKVNNPGRDMDMAYYITAHEVAHQWWGHQVIAAKVKGSALLSEGMAQYSALMVMKHQFPPEVMGRYLKYELDNYLSGRAVEKRKEQPLKMVEGQNYIHYHKASLIFYALQDYIGEESINKAFQNYNRKWSYREDVYPTSSDLLTELKNVIPDSLQYLIQDMFETITLFENKAIEAVYEEKPGGGYAVTIKFFCEKMQSDNNGLERETGLHDWIDIGIYSGDRLLYLKKHLINKKENTLTVWVNEKPTRAGVDPLHKLIDRHTNDNLINVSRLIEIGSLPLEE